MTCIKLKNTAASASAEGWVLIDDFGLPRFWATIWADVLKADIASTTRRNHLYAIERFYSIVDLSRGSGSLDRMLAHLDMPEIESALGSLLTSLRNHSTRFEANTNKVWASAKSFVADVVTHISVTSAGDYSNLQHRLERLERLYAQVNPSTPTPPAPIRALPPTVIDDLYDIFSPYSERNPFRTPELKWRNFLIFMLLLHLGLRRGEIAILPVDAFNSEFDMNLRGDKHWIDIVENPYGDDDTRFDVPSLKTAYSRRQLPISQEILSVSDIVLDNFRYSSSSSFFFCSQHRKPLSLRSINRVFEVATSKLTSISKKRLFARGKSEVTPHDLRHTSAVFRLARYMNANDNLDLAVEKLRVFFGWDPSSSMPKYYARAYFESDASDVWTENYDCLLATLRSVYGNKNE